MWRLPSGTRRGDVMSRPTKFGDSRFTRLTTQVDRFQAIHVVELSSRIGTKISALIFTKAENQTWSERSDRGFASTGQSDDALWIWKLMGTAEIRVALSS